MVIIFNIKGLYNIQLGLYTDKYISRDYVRKYILRACRGKYIKALYKEIYIKGDVRKCILRVFVPVVLLLFASCRAQMSV